MASLRTLSSICDEHELDLDESLVVLWDAGFEDIDDPDDRIPSKSLSRVLAALEVENPKDLTKVDYWLDRLEMTRGELADELAEMGLSLRADVRKLPKGALRRLRRKYMYKRPIADATSIPPEPKALPLEWPQNDAQEQLTYLTEDDLLAIHAALVDDFKNSEDPIDPSGVRSHHLVGSTASRPLTAHGDRLKYPTIDLAAAALMHSVVHNHCFFNGNKRTGLVAMLVFLDCNSRIATCDEKDLFRFTLRLAQHRLVPRHYDQRDDREVLTAAQWIRSNSRSVNKGERPIPGWRLKRILREFDCDYSAASGRGNRLDIRRTVPVPGRLRRHRTRVLRTQIQYSGDGQEMARNTIHKIRDDLWLDEAHGIDSHVFYEAEATPDDFIQTHRTLLRRLGKL
ncbi:type II toxin-antitoxin system death-on-curing family toxin [Candidatus Poriferisodalis sp.]|uniref:type II toxin-antitoxin system death-on-curing family toxin n=1 Tax=Candidatus Poriferisodalis sp. TaxID=3101277 RepID=UPI003B01BD0C